MNSFLRIYSAAKISRIKFLRFLRGLALLPRELKSNRENLGKPSALYATHLGLGDQILCIPLFLELAKRYGQIDVVISKEALPLIRQFTGELSIVFHIIDRPDSVFDKSFVLEVQDYARKHNLRPVYLGWDLLRIFKFLQPHLNEVEVFYALAGVDIDVFHSFALEDVFQIDLEKQFKPEESVYALVNSFPGTLREIPDSVIKEIKLGGLSVLENPVDVPYDSLIHLIRDATELHLVNSSLLCFALLIKSNAQIKNIYLIREDLYPGLGFYDTSWKELALQNRFNKRNTVPKRVERVLLYSKLLVRSNSFFRRSCYTYLTRYLFGSDCHRVSKYGVEK